MYPPNHASWLHSFLASTATALFASYFSNMQIFIVSLPCINLPWLLIVYRINSKLLRPQSFKIYLSVLFKLHCSSVLPLALCQPKLLAATVCRTNASMAPSCTHPCPLPGLSSSVSSSWLPSSYTSPDFTLWKKVCRSLSRGWLFVTPELYSPWNFLGQNTGVGSLSLATGDLPNPGIEPRSPALQNLVLQILYQLSHKGSPRTLEQVAYPFSSRSSRPRNCTRISCIADGFFTNWAIREAQILH